MPGTGHNEPGTQTTLKEHYLPDLTHSFIGLHTEKCEETLTLTDVT